MLNDFIVGHKSTFSDFMEIYVEIFSTSTEFLSANLTIFSKSGWQFPTLIRSILDNSEFFSGVYSEYPDNSENFSGVIRSIRTIPNFFRGQFGVFGQFRIFSRNSELISELYAENIWKFIKILCFFHGNIFFLIQKSPNTPNYIFRANIWNLLLRP